jgi:hypothetical protein
LYSPTPIDVGVKRAGSGLRARHVRQPTWFGAERAALQSWTTSVPIDGVHQYRNERDTQPDGSLEKKLTDEILISSQVRLQAYNRRRGGTGVAIGESRG